MATQTYNFAHAGNSNYTTRIVLTDVSPGSLSWQVSLLRVSTSFTAFNTFTPPTEGAPRFDFAVGSATFGANYTFDFRTGGLLSIDIGSGTISITPGATLSLSGTNFASSSLGIATATGSFTTMEAPPVTIGTTSRPAYVYDAQTYTWVPIGVGPHTHDEYVDKVLFDNKGDILVGTGEDTLGKLAVGEDGQFLVVDLDEPTGLTWRTLNANIDVSATAPSGPTSGSVWFNSSEGIAYIYYDSYWVPLSPSQAGPQGDAGVFVSATAPLNTDVIWVDTDEEPDVPVPAGGTNGQVLAKFSSNDYETAWVPQNLRTFADAATRAAAIPSPTEGMVSYLNDSNLLSIYDGSDWKASLSTSGGVLQVVTGTTSTAVSSTTGTWIDTGLTATITPKSSTSNILVIASQNGVVKSSANASNAVQLQIVYPNGSTAAFGWAIGFTGSAIVNYNAVTGQGIYTHGTLSSITFKTQFNSFASTASAIVQEGNSRSQITLIEVAN